MGASSLMTSLHPFFLETPSGTSLSTKIENLRLRYIRCESRFSRESGAAKGCVVEATYVEISDEVVRLYLNNNHHLGSAIWTEMIRNRYRLNLEGWSLSRVAMVVFGSGSTVGRGHTEVELSHVRMFALLCAIIRARNNIHHRG
eukprot:scaffold144532_cov58-Attheya_sp.AAC.2